MGFMEQMAGSADGVFLTRNMLSALDDSINRAIDNAVTRAINTINPGNTGANVFTYEQFARTFDVSQNTIRNWARNGEIAIIGIGGRRYVQIDLKNHSIN